MSGIRLYQRGCLEVLPQIPDGSIDAIITDLPYGVTNKSSEAGRWDSQIPLEPLWEQFLRVAKQMEELNGREASHPQGWGKHKVTNRCYGKVERVMDSENFDYTKKFPGSILRFPRPHCTGNHPTEKSVDLCRWLIRTFTNRGEVVLDATMGSGTTGVACVLERRGFCGMETEPKYFEIAKRRIEEAERKPKQGELF